MSAMIDIIGYIVRAERVSTPQAGRLYIYKPSEITTHNFQLLGFLWI